MQSAHSTMTSCFTLENTLFYLKHSIKLLHFPRPYLKYCVCVCTYICTHTRAHTQKTTLYTHIHMRTCDNITQQYKLYNYIVICQEKVGIFSTIYSRAYFSLIFFMSLIKTKCKVKPQNYISLTSNFLKASGTFV